MPNQDVEPRGSDAGLPRGESPGAWQVAAVDELGKTRDKIVDDLLGRWNKILSLAFIYLVFFIPFGLGVRLTTVEPARAWQALASCAGIGGVALGTRHVRRRRAARTPEKPAGAPKKGKKSSKKKRKKKKPRRKRDHR